MVKLQQTVGLAHCVALQQHNVKISQLIVRDKVKASHADVIRASWSRVPSPRTTPVGEDCVTSQKNVCVGGYIT